jgi:hypothetical protein
MPNLSSLIQGLNNTLDIPCNIGLSLGFTDFEHLGLAYRANALGGRPPILHGNCLGVLHFLLGAALHTITLHSYLLFVREDNPSVRKLSSGA